MASPGSSRTFAIPLVPSIHIGQGSWAEYPRHKLTLISQADRSRCFGRTSPHLYNRRYEYVGNTLRAEMLSIFGTKSCKTPSINRSPYTKGESGTCGSSEFIAP